MASEYIEAVMDGCTFSEFMLKVANFNQLFFGMESLPAGSELKNGPAYTYESRQADLQESQECLEFYENLKVEEYSDAYNTYSESLKNEVDDAHQKIARLEFMSEQFENYSPEGSEELLSFIQNLTAEVKHQFTEAQRQCERDCIAAEKKLEVLSQVSLEDFREERISFYRGAVDYYQKFVDRMRSSLETRELKIQQFMKSIEVDDKLAA